MTMFEVGDHVIFNDSYQPSTWTGESGIIKYISYGFYTVYFFNIKDINFRTAILDGRFLNKLHQLQFNFNEL